MRDASLLAYFIARRNAAELDRRGIPPGLFIRTVVGVACFAGCGLAAMVVFAVVAAGLAMAGVIS